MSFLRKSKKYYFSKPNEKQITDKKLSGRKLSSICQKTFNAQSNLFYLTKESVFLMKDCKEIAKEFNTLYKTLKKGGYNVSLKYTPTENQDENNQQREQRKRKIIWFNPPYSLKIKTNVGKLFLKLLDCHFPGTYKFHKRFNRNTVKISYCCMKNMGFIISSHNKQVSQPRNENYGCNCRKKESLSVRQQVTYAQHHLRNSNY